MVGFTYDVNRKQLERLCADAIAKQLGMVIARQGQAVFAVPGGRSVSGIFSELSNREVDWQRVKIFVVDERQVPMTSSESNFAVINQYLLEPLNERKTLPPDNFFPYDVTQGIKKYQQQLESVGGKFKYRKQ